MLQVARLATRHLGEAGGKVVDFLRSQFATDGGAMDRAGKSDLYYTPFALESLLALDAPLPRALVGGYLAGFGAGDELDAVHRSCLVRSWACLGEWPTPDFGARTVAAVEAHRSADGGYARREGAAEGTMYDAFLALGVYQDLEAPIPEVERLREGIERLRLADGGYSDSRGLGLGMTPSTAAAAAILREIGPGPSPGMAEWLFARAHPGGGFLAVPEAPIPDLLSTATALHALAAMGVSLDPLREPCLDFLDSLWTGRAFVGHWEDDDEDCEYTFYALLALGHLAT